MTHRRPLRLLLLVFLAGIGGMGGGFPALASETTEAVNPSVQSYNTSISADGQFVAYEHRVVVNGTALPAQIYVKDRQTGTAQLMSCTPGGAEGNGYNITPSINANGRYVAFVSHATNLVFGDTNGQPDVFVKDRISGSIERVSLDGNGFQANAASGLSGIGSGISADGRYIAFYSEASNLVNNDFNGKMDVYVKDRQTGVVRLASATGDGVQGTEHGTNPTISADGRFVAYDSVFAQFSRVYVKDLQTGSLNQVDYGSSPSLSGDGRYLAYMKRYYNDADVWITEVFIKDLQTGESERVSLSPSENSRFSGGYYPSMSTDGRYVAYGVGDTQQPNNDIVYVFVRDRSTGAVYVIPMGLNNQELNGQTFPFAISGNGAFLTYVSRATHLVPGVTDGNPRAYVDPVSQHGTFLNLARFESQSVPGTMVAGRSYTVAVTMRNTGTSTWTRAGGYCLTLQPIGTKTWQTQLAYLPSGVSVSPGAAYTFNFPVTAPSAEGSYTFQSQMARQGVQWFGGKSEAQSVQVDLTGESFVSGAEFVSQNVLPAMQAGGVYAVSVTMKNTGNTTWRNEDGFVLSSQNPITNTNWGANLVRLPAGISVQPGQSHTFTWNVTAPSTPGSYNFQWRMAQSGVGWFGEFSMNVGVTVGHLNKSAFVTQSVPSVMNPGGTYSVSVTMKNTGSAAWSRSAGFVLTSQNPLSNTTWGPNLVNLPPGVTVPPGGTHTFAFTIKAPATRDAYHFQWRMAQSGVGWFGDMTPDVNVVVGPHDAQFVSQSVPSTMTAGQKYVVSVTMKNTGSTEWTRTYRFVLSSQNPQANNTWGTNLRYLSPGVSVLPGQSYTFTFVATAPATPGTYPFQWRMAQEGFGWWGEFSPDVAVTVN